MSDEQVDVVTLGDVVHMVWRAWKQLLAGFVLGVLAGLLAAIFTKPVYRSQIVVTPVDNTRAGGGLADLASQFGGLASLAGVNIAADGERNEALAILRSRAFAQQLIADEGMMPHLFASKWDKQKSKWKELDPRDIPTQDDAFEVFDKRLRTILEDRDRGLITVRVEWRDRQLAARWANLMIQRVNEQMRARRLTEIRNNLGYLDRELENAKVIELQQAIYRLIEAQIKERMMASVRVDYAFRVIDPAVVADADRQIRPKRALWMVLGAAFGLIGAGAWIVLRRYRAVR